MVTSPKTASRCGASYKPTTPASCTTFTLIVLGRGCTNSLLAIISSPVAISPDRTRLAYAFSSDALRIHILNLGDFSEHDFTFDLTFVNNLTWLDGHSLLLTAVGGN